MSGNAMPEITRIPDGTGERLCFNGFSIPVLPALRYQADGPDKKKPDRLFIEDREGRFLLYLEAGRRFPEEIPEDYERAELLSNGKHLTLIYPLQREKPELSVGYFRIRFPGSPAECCGDLSIRRPRPYAQGLRMFKMLRTLLDAMTICKKEENDIGRC